MLTKRIMDRKRPRINPKERMVGAMKVEDNLEFKANKCTKQARYIVDTSEMITLEIWFDKHYFTRKQHGDDDGLRVGIDEDEVKNLIVKSLKYMLFYSSRVSGFTFLNHESPVPIRIVLQDSSNGITPNVPIEVHLINFLKYEVTVNTALRVNEFKIADGQYAIEILDENCSVLKKFVRGKIEEIFNCQN
jgi:hypothetical protein